MEHAADDMKWIGPAILLVDLDAFFASVEQRDHPAWRGKPVIVGGDADKHGVVSTASYEARAFGVHSAMPASAARRLCPNAIWTHGHFDVYRKTSAQVMDILRSETPALQQVSIDEAFLDVSPTLLNVEHPLHIAQRIQERVSMLGITCSIGVGTSKTVAKIASDMDKPRGLTVVYPGRERAFLDPLPIRALSGVGARAEEELRRHGIRTLGQMAEAPDTLLRAIYGKNADMMRNRCLGLDATPVAPDTEAKSVSSETTLAVDLTEFSDIAAVADSMAAKVGRRLRRKNLAGHTLTLKLRFSDRSVKTVQRQLNRMEDNEHAIRPLLHEMVADVWRDGMAVRLVGVSIGGFSAPQAFQDSLFDAGEFTGHPVSSVAGREPSDDDPISGSVQVQRASKPQMKRQVSELSPDQGRQLAMATDKVKDRFGEGAVFFGRDLHVKGKTTGTAAKNPEDYLK